MRGKEKPKRHQRHQRPERESSSESQERERSRDEKNRQYWRRDEQAQANLEVIRSLERIRQERETLIDKFVKILLIYQGKFPYDPKLHEIMAQPKLFLSRIPIPQIEELFLSYTRFSLQFARGDQPQDAIFARYWGNVGKIMEHYSHGKHQMKEELKAKIQDILDKSIPDLLKLEAAVDLTLKNPSFGMDLPYWEAIKRTIEAKVAEHELMTLYSQFKLDRAEEEQQIPIKEEEEEPLSPLLAPASSVNPKLFTTQLAEDEERNQLAAKIFKEEFQKCRQKLEDNLSLPKNHNLFSRQLVSQSTAAYDFITQQIIEFEKYKRMEEDEEDFDQWIPTDTEGRFRDRKPQYINRVRVSCEWNKYNQTHFSEDNPPPKSIQGYKFNIFYPDLCDKQKTPQYYLEQLESPDYCLIKFKAGPPYKDIAFKIQRRQWDFSEKSGFESIFAKGILHLYFNFKKPRFRI